MENTNNNLLPVVNATESVGMNADLVSQETIWLKNYTSKQTKSAYSIALRDFVSFYKLTTPDSFRQTSAMQIINYRDYLIEDCGLSNRSVRSKMAAIGSCFRHLKKAGLIEKNPVDDIERPSVDDSINETPSLSDDQVRAFLQQPDTSKLIGMRDSAILHFLFFTGSRIGSPGTIKVKDFYEDDGYHVLKWTKKGGQSQIVPAHPALIKSLNEYLNNSEHSNNPEAPLFAPVQFANNDGSKGLTRSTFSNIWKKYRIKAGVPDTFTPHSSRATYATRADQLGIPLQDIQATLGHADPNTTQRYIKSKKGYKDASTFKMEY